MLSDCRCGGIWGGGGEWRGEGGGAKIERRGRGSEDRREGGKGRQRGRKRGEIFSSRRQKEIRVEGGGE